MTASRGRIGIAPLSRQRQALVRRWLERAMTEMYESEGVDKGFTLEETEIVHKTIDIIANQFKE